MLNHERPLSEWFTPVSMSTMQGEAILEAMTKSQKRLLEDMIDMATGREPKRLLTKDELNAFDSLDREQLTVFCWKLGEAVK